MNLPVRGGKGASSSTPGRIAHEVARITRRFFHSLGANIGPTSTSPRRTWAPTRKRWPGAGHVHEIVRHGLRAKA